MKKAPNIGLSLRKLLIATLAVGPLAILPSPVWAVIPTSSSFTANSGTATVSSSGTVANINTSDRAVLQWNAGQFTIGATETWNFILPAGGAVLNRVGNATAAVPFTDTATIAGTLLSNGKVFVLANGAINVANGATINTGGGLVLSTLREDSDGPFVTLGDLTYTGASTGAITIGAVNAVSGNLTAVGGTVSNAGTNVTGDLVLRSVTAGSGIDISATAPLSVGGNLSVTTVNGTISGTNAVTVGLSSTGNQTATFNSGTGAVTFNSNANDFETLIVNTSTATGSVTVRDANIVTFGASTIGGDLDVRAGGMVNTTAISTNGTITVGGNATFVSASAANSGVNIGSNSSITGVVSALTAGGAVTINTTGNLTLGNITTNATATTLLGGPYAPLAGTSTVAGGGVTGVSLTAGTTSPIYTGNSTNNGVTFTAPTASATAVLTGGAVTGTSGLVGGSGYAAAPIVTIVGGGGSGATATATLTGDTVTGITITAGGSGFTSVPTIIVAPPVAGATAASGTIIRDSVTGLVTGVRIDNAGVGYGTTAPAVSFVAVNTGNNYSSSGVTANTTGNLTTVSVSPAGTAGAGLVTNPLTGAAISPGIRSGQGVSLTGSNVTTGSIIIGAGNAVTSMTATNGNVTINPDALASATTITANRISVTATGGYISQGTATVISTSNGTANSVFNAGATGTVALEGANTFNASGPIQVTAGTATLRSANNLTIGTTNVTGNYSVRTEPTAAAAKNIVLGAGAGTGNVQNITVGGILSVTANSTGTITDNDESSFNVFGGLNLQTGVAGVSAGGAITLDAAIVPGAVTPSVRFGQVNANTGLAGGAVSIAETTTLNLGNITASSLTAQSTTGGIIDTGNITLTGVGTFTVNATNGIVLDGTNNVIPTLNVIGGNDNAITNLAGDVILGGSTNVTGNLTVGTAVTPTARNISIGGIAATGNVTINSGGWIDVVGNANITGNLTLIANGNIASASTLNSAGVAFGSYTPGTANATSTVGLINDAGGNVTGISSSNLPLLTYSVAPTVTITNQVGAPVGSTPATATATLNSFGQITGFNITNGGTGYNRALAAPTVTIAGGTSNTSITQTGGTLNVTGTTSITSVGNAVLFRGNDFNNVVLSNSTGGAQVNDVNNLTVSGSSGGMVVARAGASGNTTIGLPLVGGPAQEANAWALTLGNLNVNALTAVSSNGGSGNSGTLTQATGTNIHSENTAAFSTTNNNIVIGNNGNSFGRVEISVGSTDGSRTVTLVEDGTLKLGNLSSRGNTTLTSRFGSIIEDPTADVAISQNGTLTVNSANGSINIGNTTHTVGATTGNVVTVVASAPNGAVAVQSSANLTLGNITALSLTAASGNNLAQSGSARIYGASNFSATNNITLTDAGNNFGRVSLTSNTAGANIAITEAGTLNIGSVSMGSRGNATTAAAAGNGTFTATSISGDIIDTGLGGAKFGGLVAPAGVPNAGALLSGSGLVTLSAANGNIVLDDPTTDFHTTAGVVFTGRNVTLSPLGSTAIILGATNATATAANLTVTSATGSILNGGNVTVTEDAVFQTGNGNITLTQAGNRFGTVRFSGNQVRITQTNDINIVTGSSAIGLAEFVSGSYITIANRGGIVTFGSTANFTAASSITLPKLLQAAGTITVNAADTKDLSALSIAADLAGRTPVNLGTGTYVPPQP